MNNAAKKSTGRATRKASPARVGTTLPAAAVQEWTQTDPATLTQGQLADMGRRYIQWRNDLEAEIAQQEAALEPLRQERAEREQREAAHKAERERIEREGIALRGPRRVHALRLLGEINEHSYSIQRLAVTATCTTETHEQACLLTAMQAMAVLNCRYADVVAEYLDDSPAYGNYAENFHPMTLEESDRIEQQEREEQAAA